MISYHPDSEKAPVGQTFTAGFKTVDTNDPERIAKGIVRFAWSPIVFRGGYRHRDNFLFADWLGLDFEDPNFGLGDALNAFSDMIHIIGTTRNHQVAKGGLPPIDRYRVLVKLENGCESLPDYEWTLRRMRHRYPIDKACVDGARHFFPCREIVSVQDDGYTEAILVAPPPEPPEDRLARLKRTRERGVLPSWVSSALLYGASQGSRSTRCYQLGCRLAELGFSLDDAISRVLASPLAAIGTERLTGSVTNGFLRAQADMEALDDAGANRKE